MESTSRSMLFHNKCILKPATVQQGAFLFALLSYFVAIFTQYKFYYYAFAFACFIAAMLSLCGAVTTNKVLRCSKSLLVFFLYALLTSAWAAYPLDTYAWVAADSLYLFVWGMAYIAASNNNTWRLSSLFLWTLVAAALVALYAYVTYGVLRPQDERSLALGASCNTVSVYLCMSLPLLIWRAKVSKNRLERLPALLCIGLLLLFQSRAALLAMPLILLLSLVAYERNLFGVARALTIFFVAVGLAVGILLSFSPDALDPVGLAVSERFNEESLSVSAVGSQQSVDFERKLMQEQAYRSFLESPIVGIGYCNLWSVLSNRYNHGITAHGLPVTLFTETGVVGAGIFLWVIIGFFANIRRTLRTSTLEQDRMFCKGLCVAMIGLLFVGLFHQVHQLAPLYVILGMASALAANAARNR